MGVCCCCLRDECEDLVNPNSSMYRNCLCLRSFVQNFLLLALYFHEGGSNVCDTLSSLDPMFYDFTGIHHCFIEENKIFLHLLLTASLDNSLSDVYRSPPRPLPYDADPRYFRLQRDGLVSRQEKGSGHSHEETEPLQRSDIDDDSEYLSRGNKWNVSKSEVESKENDCKFSVKMSTAKTTAGFANIYSSSEDEDVCPTCLEARPAIYSRRPKNNDKMLSPLPPGLHI